METSSTQILVKIHNSTNIKVSRPELQTLTMKPEYSGIRIPDAQVINLFDQYQYSDAN